MDEGNVIMCSGMNFLVIFRKKNGKRITKDLCSRIDSFMDTTFIKYAIAGNGVYIATGLNPMLFHPSEDDDMLSQIHDFIDTVSTGCLMYLGEDDLGVMISMIAPIFAVSTVSTQAGGDFFTDVEEVLSSEKPKEAGKDDEPPKPKTKADKWLDSIVDDMQDGDK